MGNILTKLHAMFDPTMCQFPHACQEPIEKQLTLRGKEFKMGHIWYSWEFMFHEKNERCILALNLFLLLETQWTLACSYTNHTITKCSHKWPTKPWDFSRRLWIIATTGQVELSFQNTISSYWYKVIHFFSNKVTIYSCQKFPFQFVFVTENKAIKKYLICCVVCI